MFAANRGQGFSITFKNGWTVSVQFGSMSYCSNKSHDADGEMPPRDALAQRHTTRCVNAEVGVLKPNETGFSYPEGETESEKEGILSWQTPAEVLAILTNVEAY